MRLSKAIFFLLLLSAPIFFYNAISWSLPRGFAGLYALFAEELAGNHYQLPEIIPFYGPGGIPLAYPPLAIYTMAFFTNELQIDPLLYLRFFPPLIAWLSLIPVYLLAESFSKRNLKSTIATFFFSCSPAIFIMHVYAGGAIRAPAFLFTATGLWFAHRAMDHDRLQPALLAALCFALTALTHLGYLFFFALSLAVFTLMDSHPRKRLKYAIIIFALGLGLSSPWWFSISQDYGIQVFQNALNSHETLSFTNRLFTLNNFDWVWKPIAFAYFSSPILGGLTISGLLWAGINRRWRLPLWFFITLLITSEGWHFLVLIGAILAGEFLGDLTELFEQRFSRLNASRAITRVFIILILFTTLLTSLSYITSAPPGISQETIQLGKWFQSNTPKDAHYLLLSPGKESDEWLPYFLRRTPSVGFWGSEWLGTYDLQHNLTLGEVPKCMATQSLQCLENMIHGYDLLVDYFVLPVESEGGPLFEVLQSDSRFTGVYDNPSYRVWQHQVE